jgi:hypothetical protein
MLVIGTVGCGGVNYTSGRTQDASGCWPVVGLVGVGFQFAGTATRVSAAVEPFDGKMMEISINELRLDVELPGLGLLRIASAGWAFTVNLKARQLYFRLARIKDCAAIREPPPKPDIWTMSWGLRRTSENAVRESGVRFRMPRPWYRRSHRSALSERYCIS